MSVERITVVGGGTMGNGIVHVSAQAGRKVTLVDMSQEFLDRALATIEKNMDRQVKKEKITAEEKASALGLISTSTSRGPAAPARTDGPGPV